MDTDQDEKQATLDALTEISVNLDRMKQQQTALIMEARSQGATLRAIGEAAGLNHMTISNTIQKHAV